jgi:hypothetical protein
VEQHTQESAHSVILEHRLENLLPWRLGLVERAQPAESLSAETLMELFTERRHFICPVSSASASECAADAFDHRSPNAILNFDQSELENITKHAISSHICGSISPRPWCLCINIIPLERDEDFDGIFMAWVNEKLAEVGGFFCDKHFDLL